MTTVCFYKTNGIYYGFEEQGHTGFAESGEDILCSALSAMTMLLINTIECSYDSIVDYTIDEKGNTFIALRKIDWGNKGEYKLDLRKYYASESGETMSKGTSFLTDDGPNELTKVLIETGYGDDYELADVIIKDRPYIAARIKSELENNRFYAKRIEDIENVNDEDVFYDPEELIS